MLLGGCDKTTPALIMGAISMGIPSIYVPAGPMLRGNWRGQHARLRLRCLEILGREARGNITDDDWNEIEGGIARSFGTCMVMGTAATMMAIAEAMGLALPGASSIPAADSSHPRMCFECRPAHRRHGVGGSDARQNSQSPAAFENAIRVHMALGGSTNAIMHVVAMARRAGIALDMERFDEISRQVPVIANITPSGKFLMEDFYYAGGIRALMTELRDLLDLSCMTVTGKTVGENIAGAKSSSAGRRFTRSPIRSMPAARPRC